MIVSNDKSVSVQNNQIDTNKIEGKLNGNFIKILGEKYAKEHQINWRSLKGKFVNDRLQSGKIILWTGAILKGEFENCILIKGKISFKGRIQKGEFKNGKLNGQGKIKDHSKNYYAEGSYINGELHGKGKETYLKAYRQPFKINKGIFENGIFVEGKQISDKSIKKGKFKDNKLISGKNTKNGEEKGTFDEGDLQGPGTMILKHEKIKGIFKDGILVEGEKINFNCFDQKSSGKEPFIQKGSFVGDLLHGDSEEAVYWDGTVKKGTFNKSSFVSGTTTPPEDKVSIIPY